MVFILSLALFACLAVTRSLYVEVDEASFITVLVMIKAFIWSRSFQMPAVTKNVLFLPAFFFLLFWGWSFADIAIDHVLFFNSGNIDGQHMSIGFKVDESADDIFLLSVTATIIAAAFSLIVLSLKEIPYLKR